MTALLPAATSATARRVLVLSSTPDVGPVVCQALSDADILALECDGVLELCRQVARGAAAAIIAEDALTSEEWKRVSSTVASASRAQSGQTPLIVMLSGGSGRTHSGILPAMETQPCLVMERPVDRESLIAAIRSVLDANLPFPARQEGTREQAGKAPTSVGYLDGSGTYRFVSPGFAEWFGLRHGEVLGRTASEVGGLSADTDRPGREPQFELTARTREGGTRVGLVRMVAREESQGKVGHYVTVSDITDLKRAQEALHARERHQREIAGLGQAALSRLELQGLLEESVAAVMRALEVDLCGILELQPANESLLLRAGKGWKPGLVGSAKVSATRSPAGRAMQAGKPLIIGNLASEFAITPPPLPAEHGAVSGVICLIGGESSSRPWGVIQSWSRAERRFGQEDVDFLGAVATIISNAIHRIRIEQALRESRQRLALAHMAAGSGAWEYDLVTGAQVWSPEMYDLYGVDPNVPRTGENRWEPVHPADRDRVQSHLHEVIAAREDNWNIEFRIVHPRTGVRWLAGFGKVIYDGAGSALRILGIDIDITARKTADEQGKRTAAAYALFAGLIQGQEEERRRIARDLHDDFAQRMAVLSMEFERACAQSPELKARIGVFQEELESISEDLRRLSHQLHPSTLEHLGLAASLQDECDRIAGVKGISAFADLKGEFDDLPKALQLCVYRITQEALHNVAKHSGATQAVVYLDRNEEALKLTIADDGVGFDPETARAQGGMGLSAMEERVRPFNGVFALTSRPAEGTKVMVTIPLRFTPPPPEPV